VVGIVFAENEKLKMPPVVHNGKGVDFVIPNYIVCNLKGNILGCINKAAERSHELGNLHVKRHSADAVVLIGNNADKLARARSVRRDCNGGMPGEFVKLKNVFKRCIGTKVGIALHKARFMSLYVAHHLSLILNGLGAVDERNSALLGKRNRHRIV